MLYIYIYTHTRIYTLSFSLSLSLFLSLALSLSLSLLFSLTLSLFQTLTHSPTITTGLSLSLSLFPSLSFPLFYCRVLTRTPQVCQNDQGRFLKTSHRTHNCDRTVLYLTLLRLSNVSNTWLICGVAPCEGVGSRNCGYLSMAQWYELSSGVKGSARSTTFTISVVLVYSGACQVQLSPNQTESSNFVHMF